MVRPSPIRYKNKLPNMIIRTMQVQHIDKQTNEQKNPKRNQNTDENLP